MQNEGQDITKDISKNSGKNTEKLPPYPWILQIDGTPSPEVL